MLFLGYRQDFWWWEAVVQIRKSALLIVIAVTQVYGSVMQGLTALQITVTFLLLHVLWEAFESDICRDCETVSKACNAVILIAMIYIQTEGIAAGAADFLNLVILGCAIEICWGDADMTSAAA